MITINDIIDNQDAELFYPNSNNDLVRADIQRSLDYTIIDMKLTDDVEIDINLFHSILNFVFSNYCIFCLQPMTNIGAVDVNSDNSEHRNDIYIVYDTWNKGLEYLLESD